MRGMSGVVMESATVAQLAQENATLKATVLHLETLVDKLRFQLGQLDLVPEKRTPRGMVI